MLNQTKTKGNEITATCNIITELSSCCDAHGTYMDYGFGQSDWRLSCKSCYSELEWST